MADASTGLSNYHQDGRHVPQVWVLDDPLEGRNSPAIAVAERLGVAFRRIPLAWNWLAPVATLLPGGTLMGLTTAGQTSGQDGSGITLSRDRRRAFASASAPVLTLSSGPRSAAVSLWLRARFGGPSVHLLRAGAGASTFDLLLTPRHQVSVPAPNLLGLLGVPHRLSPVLLRQTRVAWTERLAHLPRPRVVLLVGGPHKGGAMTPAQAHDLALRLAGLARQRGGSVLVATGRETSTEAADALSAGLSKVMHILHRATEPGEEPSAGFLSWADAVVVAQAPVTVLSEACATSGPVLVASAGSVTRSERRLYDSFFEAGHAKPLRDDLSPWPRAPLDEAGRVAAEIVRRFPLD
jgi:mitochondrial fission protein ELM1